MKAGSVPALASLALTVTVLAGPLSASIEAPPQRRLLVETVVLEAPVKVGPAVPIEPPSPVKDALAKTGEAAADAAMAAGFDGEIIVDMGATSWLALAPALRRRGYATQPGKFPLWPFASLSKQLVAAAIMNAVDVGLLELEAPASKYLRGFAAGVPVPTVRQLLQHRSGLHNPDDTPAAANGFPQFYARTDGGDAATLSWCLDRRSAPLEDRFVYNNCDFIVLGKILESVDTVSLAEGIRLDIAERTGMMGTVLIDADNIDGFALMDEPERSAIPAFGAAGGFGGPLLDIMLFDKALMAGRLLPGPVLETMWTPAPKLGNMALGQWVYEARLTGCAAPVRVVERHGEIGRYQLRNIMLPDLQRSVIMATGQQDEFAYGEIWRGEGLLFDVVSIAACGVPAS